jgi:SP family general alpha glucoside:H+ symporter-like MFS transporter
MLLVAGFMTNKTSSSTASLSAPSSQSLLLRRRNLPRGRPWPNNIWSSTLHRHRQLTANLVLKGTGTPSSTLAYKIPFSLQFFFPLVLLLFLPFAPESPWYLARTSQNSLALSTLSRLGYPFSSSTFSSITNTILHEQSKAKSTTYLDCFRGPDIRRTEIATGIFTVAQLTGIVFVIGY